MDPESYHGVAVRDILTQSMHHHEHAEAHYQALADLSVELCNLEGLEPGTWEWEVMADVVLHGTDYAQTKMKIMEWRYKRHD